MLDTNFIRENPQAVKQAISAKQVDLDLDEVLTLDQTVRTRKQQIENLRQERNTVSKATASADGEERSKLVERGRAINEQLKLVEPQLKECEEQLRQLLLLVPNISAPDEPVGASEDDNIEFKRWGEAPRFEFSPADHIQILQRHNWAEFEKASKVSGARSYILKNEMVILEMALWHFAIDRMVRKGFTLMTIPSFAREEAFMGTGHFPSGRREVYFLPSDDLYISGTAEVGLNYLHSGEILDESNLPLLYTAFSPCFRREAGAAGRDVRGLVRVHQFNKVEQYVMCKADTKESWHWFQNLLTNAEEIVQALEIPYRVVRTCTSEMGSGKVRMWDIECWVPSQQLYRETHSVSELHSWQARRANLRYRDNDGQVHFVFTLNNTAIATPRILVPFLENHQQADGSVRIPQTLQSYLGGLEWLG